MITDNTLCISQKWFSAEFIVAEFEALLLIDGNVGEGDAVVYSDGYVHRGGRLGWGFSVRIKRQVIAGQSGAYGSCTSSMRMEVATITVV